MKRSREYKVGAFVLAGMVALGGVIFMIGEERHLFERKIPFQTAFTNVQGLSPGSPVRMGGVDIGRVTQVGYAEDANDRKIHVTISVLSDQAPRIKADSVASIEGKGLLGDKMITISIGTATKASVPEGGTIGSTEGDDLTAMMGKLGNISVKVEKVVENLERTSASLADDQLHKDLKGMASSLNNVLGSVDRREGYVGKVISDPGEAERLSQLVKNLENVTGELDRTASSVNQVLERVKTGPGLAHELIYGEESSKAVAQFGGAADELRLTLKGIREGDGMAKTILFGGQGNNDSQELVRNVNAMSNDLRLIVADLRAGKGTLGALLVDPSVYEDLKMVLGNVERNRALRALVRYSIRRDEATGTVRDSAPAPAPAQAGSAAGTLKGGLAGEPAPGTP
jgi:phospholipid/cholesterol/gamma-HCH transport system substrate-binding protein